jgi:hypothetical protein
VHFNDWMFLQPSGVLLNRARVSKFGITIGEVTLAFMKADKMEAARESANENTALSASPAARAAMQATGR